MIDFVVCPKCRSRNWNDIPNVADVSHTRFRCLRCGYTMLLGACSHCGTEKAWRLTRGIEEKGAYRPMYRFKCRSCGRLIGILLG